METIDFVLPWVDNNSPSWIAERERVWNLTHPQERKESGDDNGASRYREMGMLEYWFRSVEKFAPWVNKVFFVTCGQKPDWLNVDNPKLVLVDHKDYIPVKYLPTFNSNVIELNLFRIAELSEHFVLFNDDVFLTRPVSPEFFFVNGQPSLSADLTICDYYGVNYWSYACFNDSCVLNDHFNMYESIAKNRDKWFSVKKLGWRSALKNRICHTINRTMFNRGYEHLSNAHLKSTFRTVWETCPEIMEATSMQRFRTWDQVNQWLVCAWNQASGAFYPARPYSHGSHFNVTTGQLEEVCQYIRNQSLPQVCVNDSAANDEPEAVFRAIRMAFDAILPEKSSFEL